MFAARLGRVGESWRGAHSKCRPPRQCASRMSRGLLISGLGGCIVHNHIELITSLYSSSSFECSQGAHLASSILLEEKMGGQIDCYVDIGKIKTSELAFLPSFCPLATGIANSSAPAASFYSYLCFVHLIKNLKTLELHDVQVECVVLSLYNSRGVSLCGLRGDIQIPPHPAWRRQCKNR